MDGISGGKTDKKVHPGRTCRHQGRQEHEDRIYLVYNNWDKFAGAEDAKRRNGEGKISWEHLS